MSATHPPSILPHSIRGMVPAPPRKAQGGGGGIGRHSAPVSSEYKRPYRQVEDLPPRRTIPDFANLPISRMPSISAVPVALVLLFSGEVRRAVELEPATAAAERHPPEKREEKRDDPLTARASDVGGAAFGAE
jgi:hypothetical protein